MSAIVRDAGSRFIDSCIANAGLVSPREQITSIRAEIERLLAEGILNKGQANSLQTKLDGGRCTD
jgi:hypothetical protein